MQLSLATSQSYRALVALAIAFAFCTSLVISPAAARGIVDPCVTPSVEPRVPATDPPTVASTAITEPTATTEPTAEPDGVAFQVGNVTAGNATGAHGFGAVAPSCPTATVVASEPPATSPPATSVPGTTPEPGVTEAPIAVLPTTGTGDGQTDGFALVALGGVAVALLAAAYLLGNRVRAR
jgi:hypothetical protein